MNLTAEDKSFILTATAGTAAGLASVYLTGIQALLMSIVVIKLLQAAVTKALTLEPEQKEFKWWAANGIYPYIIFWVFVWALAKNI